MEGFFFDQQRAHMSKYSPDIVARRGLTIRQVSAYWGVCPTTFKKLVKQGLAPGPIDVPGLGRLLFDREQQERAFSARCRESEPS
jgi:hypothetical protein